MKKILIVIFLVTLIAGSTISMAIPSTIDKIKNDKNIINNYLEVDENDNETIKAFVTTGPKKLSITKFKINNGSLIDLTQLKQNIRSTIILRLVLMWRAPLARPIVFIISEENKLDFTIEYKKDIPNGNESRNRYSTYIIEIEDGNQTNNTIQIFNEKHTVDVEGFYGLVMITKRSFKLPPTIFIAGACDNVALVPIIP